MTADRPPPAPTAPPEATTALRQAAFALVLLLLASLAVAQLSWREDSAEATRALLDRTVRDARGWSDSLLLHLEMMEAELERLAQGLAEAHRREGSSGVPATVLRVARHDSALFGGGVALLDDQGQVRWSVPDGLLAGQPSLGAERWFARAMAGPDTAIDSLTHGRPSFVVAVRMPSPTPDAAVLIGVLDAPDRLSEPGGARERRLVFGHDGTLLLPERPEPWMEPLALASVADGLLAARQPSLIEVAGRRWSAAAVTVGETRLRVLELVEEEPALAAVRSRLLAQLAGLSLLQASTVGLFAAFLLRAYRTLRRAEQRAAEREKFAALGEASSLIAHEVKNSLNGLSTAAALLPPESDVEIASAIRAQVDRLRHLAESLLAFGRPVAARLAETSVDDLVRGVVRELVHHPERREVELELGELPGVAVHGDRALLHSVVDNLVRNAIEAAVGAKDIGRTAAPKVRVWGELQPGALLLHIADNGGGIDPTVRPRLFQPFITGRNHGIGLGLAMARRAAELMGGRIEVGDLPDGTCMTLRLTRV